MPEKCFFFKRVFWARLILMLFLFSVEGSFSQVFKIFHVKHLCGTHSNSLRLVGQNTRRSGPEIVLGESPCIFFRVLAAATLGRRGSIPATAFSTCFLFVPVTVARTLKDRFWLLETEDITCTNCKRAWTLVDNGPVDQMRA